MPDGITHHKYYKKGFVVIIPEALLLAVWDYKFAFGTLVGYGMGRWVDGDWDIMGTNNAEGRLVNEIPILGHFIFGISSTYGSIFRKHHRSFITHFPIVSTIIRLVFVLIVPFIFLDSWGINLIGNGWHMFWLGLWGGLSQADGIHWFLDKTFGGV